MNVRWLLGVVGLAFTVACGAGTSDDEDSSGGTGPTSGPSAGGSTGAFVGGAGGSGNAGPTYACSADLKYVLDEMGNVIQTCPPDQGCAAGQCVPACDAAAASQGNVGCDFVVATPHFYQFIAPPCFAAFVTNNWDKDATLTVSRGGTNYDVTTFGRIASADGNPASWAPVPSTGVPPGQVAVLFLSHDPASVNGGPLTCPVPPAVSQTNGTAIWPGDGSNGTGRGQAWHIVSNVPISAYDILPFGGASSYLPSAELIFPTSAWSDNYLAVLPPASSGPSWGQVVAQQDGTTVQVLPSVALPAGTNVDAAPANVQTTYTLAAGEYIQWQGPEMTGSIIKSDKPVSFTGGDGYQCYSSATSSGGGCDSGHQMIGPVRALGFEYVAPPFQSRLGAPESIPYRIVGAVDGTTLVYDPPQPAAPATLGLGQSVLFESTSAFKVTSQDKDHPFYIGQVMPGASCQGDEDFVNLLPPAQWLRRYVFFTDYSYPTTNLVVVRTNTGAGFKDVNIACLGPLTNWQPIGSDGKYEITTVDLQRDGAPNGTCSNGPQTADSESPFGLMVWGLSSCASYAYPAGGNATSINQVIIPTIPR